MVIPKKKRLLVFASTFPRWKDDPKPSFVFELSKRLRNKLDVYVLAPHYPGAKRQEILDGLEVYRFKYFINRLQKLAGDDGILAALEHNRFQYVIVPFFLFFEFFALLKYVRKLKPDLIHAHWIIPQGFFAFINSWIFSTPFVVTSHGSDILGLKGFKYIKRLSLKHAGGITVVSNKIKEYILNEIDRKLKIHTIPMGVDTTLFNPDKKNHEILAQYNIKRPFLLFVGRISSEKGIKYLIQAMPKVIAMCPTAKLLIVGEGRDKDQLEGLTRRLNLTNHIVFTGKISNKKLPEYYATADIFISPSLREGAPVTYVESLACCTPIVVGDLPVSREITKNNRGLTVIPNDLDDIALKIIRMLKTKKKPENELHNFVRDNYDWNVITDRFFEILKLAP